MDQEAKENNFKEGSKLASFLTYLYCLSRKIEMKVEEHGSLDILPDLDSKGNSFTDICANLDRAKEDYRSVDKDDYLKIYPLLKNLFFKYMDYIRYSVEHFTSMGEEAYPPASHLEIQPLLKQLTTWCPKT